MSNRAQPKSPILQLVLAVLFGPLGLFYSSVPAAVLLTLGALVIAKDTGGEGLWLAWPIAIATGLFLVQRWNRRAARLTGPRPAS